MTSAIQAEGLGKRYRPGVLDSGRIPELDGLRGLAILLVLLCHYLADAQHEELGFWTHKAAGVFGVGWSGVDLFFVLSGFLIGGILLDARMAPDYFKVFYIRRMHRIFPVYYSWILLYAASVAAGIWVFRWGLAASTDLLRQIPIQLLFVQNMQFGMPHFQWMWFAVTWSLAVEEQFYLIAPPVIRFLSSRKLVVALVSTVILAPWLRVFVFQNWPSHSFTATFLMPCRADTLGVGILLAMAWRNDQFRNFLAEHPLVLQRTLQGLFLGCAVLFWWLVHPISILKLTIGYTWTAMFFGCLLLMALSQRETWIARILRWKLLRQLGVVSYCVYIVHLALNEFAHELLLHAPPQVNNLRGVGVTLLSFALTLAVAGLSWVAFEKPLIRRGHNYKYWGGEEPKVPELVPTGAELRE